jgi:NAD-dependent deacetylase
MRVLFLTGSGLSADSGLPTFRGAGGLYEDLPAETFLSATTYARDPDAVEAWLDQLRTTVAAAKPNPAHLALADYQRRYPDVVLCTQNVDTLLERAGAPHVTHLHGRLDQLRCLGHAHPLALGNAARAAAPKRCPRCVSRLRSDVVLFEEPAPAYAVPYAELKRATSADALVVIGTQGNVLPINDFARAFPGRTILNNLHMSDAISRRLFTHVTQMSAAQAAGEIIDVLETWRTSPAERGRRLAIAVCSVRASVGA